MLSSSKEDVIAVAPDGSRYTVSNADAQLVIDDYKESIENWMNGKVKVARKWVPLRYPSRIGPSSLLVGVTSDFKVKFFKIVSKRGDQSACFPMKFDLRKCLKIGCLTKLDENGAKTDIKKVAFIVSPDMDTPIPSRSSTSRSHHLISVNPSTRELTIHGKYAAYKLFKYAPNSKVISIYDDIPDAYERAVAEEKAARAAMEDL